MLGVASSIGQDVPITAEVVVIQKRVTSEILDQAVQAKSRGRIVVYDVDDSGNALWYWAAPRLCHKMLMLADLVTVDTPERGEWLERASKGITVATMSNPIDYGPSGPVAFVPVERSPLRILWFGSSSTFESFFGYASALASLPNVKVVVCSERTEAIDRAVGMLNLEVRPWTREGFVDVLQSCALSCLTHDGSPDDLRKSNHKMITSVSWGVPALVSDTPEYARTAREAGVGDAVFSNAAELLLAVERYRGAAARRSYLSSAQSIVWQSYAPEHIGRMFIRIIEEAEALLTNTRPTHGAARGWLPLSMSYLLWRWNLDYDRYSLVRNWLKGASRSGANN
jgi:hypothetical protein